MNRVYVVCGSPDAQQPHGLEPDPGDLVIAADRGAMHARDWGWPVHLLVGDLDSLPPAAAQKEIGAGTPVVRAPAAKDETDTELALAYALKERPRSVIVCGALGGRTDHLLANVLLLARPDLAGRDMCLADGRETVHLLTAARSAPVAMLRVPGRPGDLLTLLPLGGDAEGVSTGHLAFPLRDETLFMGSARGTSNVFTGDGATVSLRHGLLLVVHVSKE